MKPVFFFTHEYAPFRGGVATYVAECAAAGRRLGYDVQVVTAAGGGGRDKYTTPAERLKPVEDENGTVVWRTASSGRLTPAGIISLAHGMHRLGPKVIGDAPIVAMSAGAHMALMLLARCGFFAAGRVLNFFHGSEILKLTRRLPWRWLSAAYYRDRQDFAVASNYVRRLLEDSGLCLSHARLHLAPCACAPEFLQAIGAAAADVEDPSLDVGVVPKVFRVLTVARIHPRKGQLDLAHAMARLAEPLRGRLRYQLVGTGDAGYLRETLAVCRAAGIATEHLDSVPTAQLPALYTNCDLFALTSRTLADSVEGFGIVYLEAAAFGRPVLAYATGGVPEAVLDGKTGRLVPEGNIEALRGALATLMDNHELRQRLGSAGRAFARSFSWENAARVLCEAALALPRDDAATKR